MSGMPNRPSALCCRVFTSPSDFVSLPLLWVVFLVLFFLSFPSRLHFFLNAGFIWNG